MTDSIWTETPSNRFGFKCMQDKHELCKDDWCECLCHSTNDNHNRPPPMEAIQ